MDAIQGWLASWEFRMTAYPTICASVWKSDSVDQRGPAPSYMYMTMVYAEVMLRKHVN
jgi:hypothetical protein